MRSHSKGVTVLSECLMGRGKPVTGPEGSEERRSWNKDMEERTVTRMPNPTLELIDSLVCDTLVLGVEPR